MSDPRPNDPMRVDFPDHTYPLGVARRLLQQEPKKAIALLLELQKEFAHILAIRNELALAYLRTGQMKLAVGVLEATQKEFELVDEETYCRWGATAPD